MTAHWKFSSFFNDLVHYSAEASWHLSSLEYPGIPESGLNTLLYRCCFRRGKCSGTEKQSGGCQYEMLLFRLNDTIREYNVFLIFLIFWRLMVWNWFSAAEQLNVSHVLQSVHKTVPSIVEAHAILHYLLNGDRATSFLSSGTRIFPTKALTMLEYRFSLEKNILIPGSLGRNLGLCPLELLPDSSEDELIRLHLPERLCRTEQWIKDFRRPSQQIPVQGFYFVRIYSLLGKILKFLYELNIDADLEEKL